MASYHGSTQMEPAKMEQIITEFFAKSLHIILESRSPYVSSRNYSSEQVLSSPSPSPSPPSSSCSSSSFGPRDKWFNLALRDCPAALENIDFWRQCNLEPMIVDVILFQKSGNWDPVTYSPKRGLARNLSGKEGYYYSSENDELWCDIESEKIIERWVLHYESKQSANNSGGAMGNKRATCTSSHSLYKKSMLLLRSLYATVRLLPAYKVFRDLTSSARIRAYNLGHRVSSFVEPFTRREEADMQRFVFSPVDTSCGRLCLSVLYCSSVLDISSEPSTPISPQVIHEYVGSPLANPLKRFTSVPVSQCSPSSSPFGRRHSWSYDLYRVSPSSANPSPSPTYSESGASMPKQQSHRLPPASLPDHMLNETPQLCMKDPNFHEYLPSPTFSPSSSPSPSPPTYVPDNHILKALARSESAPVGIPASTFSSLTSMPRKQLLPPSPSTGAGVRVAKKEGCSGLSQTGSTVDKLFASGKDEAGKLSGVKQSSNSSSMKSYSRSPSRFSFQDHFDDSEFSGLFIPDDDDLTEPSTRPGSFDQPGGLYPIGKSRDTAVGALICMLNKAPPLHPPDVSMSTNLVQGSGPMTEQVSHLSSSGLSASKTTADAFTELTRFKKIKESLLKQGKGTPP